MIVQVADELAIERARIVFLPAKKPEDVAVSKKIADRTRQGATVLTEEYTTGELLSLVGNLDMLIGVRLHALLSPHCACTDGRYFL